MLVTRIMQALGIICIFAAIRAMLTPFTTYSTFSVEAQQKAGVNVSIVKDAAWIIESIDDSTWNTIIIL